MTTFGQRLREERERLGLNQTDFAGLAGQQKGSQINYEAGKRSPDADFLIKIAAAGVDLTYLLTGRRSNTAQLELARRMSDLAERLKDRHADEADISVADVRAAQGDYVPVLVCAIDVSAGDGLVPVQDEWLPPFAFSREKLAELGVDKHDAAIIRVRGDSMVPTIPDGSYVLLDTARIEIANDAIYAFSREGAAYVKRVTPVNRARDGRPTSVVILSDNPAYSPDVLVGEAMNGLRIVGRVRCILSTL